MAVEAPFQIKLAGQVIQLRPLHPYLRRYCQGYLAQGEPAFSVALSQADIDFEREKSAREDALEGIPTRRFSDGYLETLAAYRKIALRLLEEDVLLFHGSALAMDGAGYLFTAKSGTGKSTHARLWRERFGDRVVMINDDKPLLQVTNRGVRVWGSPWDGKHRLSTNTSAPLKALCVLSRGADNRIAPITAREAYPTLLQQVYRPPDPAAMEKTLALVDALGASVELYALACNMEPQAALTAWEGMRGERT